jgi:hypothetical protein
MKARKLAAKLLELSKNEDFEVYSYYFSGCSFCEGYAVEGASKLRIRLLKKNPKKWDNDFHSKKKHFILID